jgi:flagellar assembly protein FliH
MSDPVRSRINAEGSSVQRWSLPEVEGPVIGKRPQNDTARDKERAEQLFRAEQARGYEAGVAAGRAEIQRKTGELDTRIRQLDTVLAFLSQPLQQLDAEVERQLALLALTVGKQLARRELTTDPAQVIAIIRDAVSRLPAAARDVRVHLHPEDAAIVRERLASATGDRAWVAVEDPALSRGGCIVRTENSQVDARFETRVNHIVTSVMGEERAPARTEPESQ